MTSSTVIKADQRSPTVVNCPINATSAAYATTTASSSITHASRRETTSRMSNNSWRTMATVTAIGMSGMANSTSTGVPATRPQGKITIKRDQHRQQQPEELAALDVRSAAVTHAQSGEAGAQCQQGSRISVAVQSGCRAP